MGNRQGLKPEDLTNIERLMKDMEARFEANMLIALEKQTKFLQRKIEEAGETVAVKAKVEQAKNMPLKSPEGGKEPSKQVKPIVTPEIKWKAQMTQIVKQLVKDFPEEYPNFNRVVNEIYKKMDRVYGVCLAQYEKEYKRNHDGIVTTIEVISSDEKLRSLFQSILETIDSRIREKAAEQKAELEKTLSMSKQEIIQPLITARHDTSHFGCASYTKVMARMRKNGIDFSESERVYKNRHQITRKVSTSELVENDPDIKKAFAQAVVELLTEVQKVGAV